MNIDFAKLHHQYLLYKKDIDANIQAVLDKSNYIMGEEVLLLERELKDFVGAKNAVSCSNGTDALLLAMMALDIQPGDEVITTPFTFIATAETIAYLKARPVFVDVDEDTFNINPAKIEAAITKKTKVIMPVSLFGQPSDMAEINAIANVHNLKVIIDGAQSFGATYKDQGEVHYCDIYTTSFFPAKPLGCYGDGGAVFTNNDELAEKMAMMRSHGQNKRYHHKYVGIGGRLDTLQAAVLLAKLPHYKNEIKNRNRVARAYSEQLGEFVRIPLVKRDRTSVWAQYTARVQKRDSFLNYLKQQGVPTAVHYPMPLHKQECFQYLDIAEGTYPFAERLTKEVFSLPMNPFLTEKEIGFIVEVIKSALK